MSIYTESLLTSRLDIDSVSNLAVKPFLKKLNSVFLDENYVIGYGLSISRFIVSCTQIDMQEMCIDIAKIYDKSCTSKKTRKLCECLLDILTVKDRVIQMGSVGTDKSMLRLQFVYNSLYHMGYLATALSIQRGTTLDALEDNLTEVLKS